MNNYFRLLFVGSILFVLLGLFNKQSKTTIAQNQAPGEIEHVEFQPGLLPVSSGTYPSPSFSSNAVDHPCNIIANLKRYENQISKMIGYQLCRIESDYSERKPETHDKTGQFLHLTTDKTEPSLL